MTIDITIDIIKSNEEQNFNQNISSEKCYLISENNLNEIIKREEEGKRVFTSIKDVDYYTYNTEKSLNDLFRTKNNDTYWKVDWKVNFTGNQREVFNDIYQETIVNHLYASRYYTTLDEMLKR